MQFIANECLAQFIINLVRALGHDVQDFKREKREGQKVPDRDLALIARQRGRILLTQDSAAQHGHWQLAPDDPGIITIRVKNRNMAFLSQLLQRSLALLDEHRLQGTIAVVRLNRIDLQKQGQPRSSIPLT